MRRADSGVDRQVGLHLLPDRTADAATVASPWRSHHRVSVGGGMAERSGPV